MKTHDELVTEVAADAGYRNEFLHLLKLRNTIQASLRRDHEETLANRKPEPWTTEHFVGISYGDLIDTAAPLLSPRIAGYVRSFHLLQDALTNALRIRYTLTPEQATALLNDVSEKYADI